MRGFWRHWIRAAGLGEPLDVGTPPSPMPEPKALPSKRPHGLDEILAGREEPSGAEGVTV
jgi:hypothetical protein